MSADDTVVLTKQLQKRLKCWDCGSPSERGSLLEQFLAEFDGARSVEMNARLAQGSSLILARFLVWLQVSYMRHNSIVTLLRTLGVFISSPDGTRFVSEMIEGGLLITLLDILLKPKFKDKEKIEAMELLNMIAMRGRRYKEAICESHGVKVLCEFIAVTGQDSKDEEKTTVDDMGDDSEGANPVEELSSASAGNVSLDGEMGATEPVTEDKREEMAVPVDTVMSQGKQHLLEELRHYNEKHGSRKLAENEEEEERENQSAGLEYPSTEPHIKDDEQTPEEKKVDEMQFVTLLKGDQDVCDVVLKKAHELFVNVTNGNPAYQSQIIHALFQLMTSVNHWAQIVACQVIRKILPQTMELCGEIIEPLLGLLGHSKTRLLYEAIQLVDIVVMSQWKKELFDRLVRLMTGPQPLRTLEKHPLYITEPDLSDFQESQLVSEAGRQIQADAILAIGYALNVWTVDAFIGSEVVLVATLANTMHQESQRRAAQVLRKLVQLVPSVGDDLVENFPSGLLNRIMIDPVDTANTLSATDARCLRMWVQAKRRLQPENVK